MTTYVFFNLKEESIKHLFYEGVFTQSFWIDIKYLIFKFTKLVKDILLVCKNKSLEQNLVINLIIMYGKYHIHKQKDITHGHYTI